MKETKDTTAKKAETATEIPEMMTSDQAAEFLGVKKSYLFKLTFNRAIPYYKPFGKRLYFDKAELVDYIKRNRIATMEEIDAEAYRRLNNIPRI